MSGTTDITAAPKISVAGQQFEQWAIRAEHATGVSLSDDGIADLFADLGGRLAAIHMAEMAAVDATAAAIGR